jgi:hypothetical protein
MDDSIWIDHGYDFEDVVLIKTAGSLTFFYEKVK